MSTAAQLVKPPTSRQEWDRFHFAHYLDHVRILERVNAKTGSKDLMPAALWPFNPSNQYPWNEAHQLLHQQMDAVSGVNTPDFLHVNLSKKEQVANFIWLNWVDHSAFHNLVGI